MNKKNVILKPVPPYATFVKELVKLLAGLYSR